MLWFAQPKYFRYYYEEINRTVHTLFRQCIRFSGLAAAINVTAAAVHKMFMMMVNFFNIFCKFVSLLFVWRPNNNNNKNVFISSVLLYIWARFVCIFTISISEHYYYLQNVVGGCIASTCLWKSERVNQPELYKLCHCYCEENYI